MMRQNRLCTWAAAGLLLLVPLTMQAQNRKRVARPRVVRPAAVKPAVKEQRMDTLLMDSLCREAYDYYNGANGKFMNRDEAKAIYIRVADAGYAPAQHTIYEKWAETDCDLALKYLRMAADQRYLPALYDMAVELWQPEQDALGQYSQYFTSYTPRLTCVTADVVQARAYARMGAEAGDTEMQFLLSQLFKGDAQQVFYWEKIAAEKEDATPEMKFRYAISLWTGQGCTQDQTTAAPILRDLNEEEYVPSMTFCAMLGSHSGDKAVVSQAAHLYELAAEKGDPFAALQYAGMLASGEGVKKDVKKAYQIWLRLASDESLTMKSWRAEAQRNVGLCLGAGIGVKRNMAEGKMWLRRAAENGDEKAQETLRQLGE